MAMTNSATNFTGLKGYKGSRAQANIASRRLRQILDKNGTSADYADNLAAVPNVAANDHVEALRESKNAKRILSAQVMFAQEKERKRISSELHDSIGSTLSAIKFFIENAILHMNERAIEESAQMFRNVIPNIQSAIEEVRRISMDLRPAILDDCGAIATLTWFCRQFQAIYEHIRIELTLDIQENDIPATLKVVIFRIVQEAMNNCAKYSHANCTHISLVNTGKTIELAVEDNGQGFDHAEVCARSKSICGGMGLDSMRERAEFSGGKFSLVSAKGKGTSVRVVWPCQNNWCNL